MIAPLDVFIKNNNVNNIQSVRDSFKKNLETEINQKLIYKINSQPNSLTWILKLTFETNQLDFFADIIEYKKYIKEKIENPLGFTLIDIQIESTNVYPSLGYLFLKYKVNFKELY